MDMAKKRKKFSPEEKVRLLRLHLIEKKDGHDQKLERQNAQLKARLAGKDEVIAEIMASHVQLKKNLGEI